MSGGGMGSGGAASRRTGYGVSVNLGAIQGRLAANPARNVAGRPDRSGGEPKRAMAQPRPAQAPAPPVQQSTGGGTGGETNEQLARAAAARRTRLRMARGGGLSNVTLGGTTLG